MTLRIDRGELLFALTSYDTDHYLDLRTGLVIFDFDDMDDEEVPLDEESERYRYIDPRPSNDGFRAMEEFALRQQDFAVREDLLRALDRQRPFRSFKDALLNYPDLREEWFAFEEEGLLAYAREWLRSEGIEAELISPQLP